jgi:hypothetical protein
MIGPSPEAPRTPEPQEEPLLPSTSRLFSTRPAWPERHHPPRLDRRATNRTGPSSRPSRRRIGSPLSRSSAGWAARLGPHSGPSVWSSSARATIQAPAGNRSITAVIHTSALAALAFTTAHSAGNQTSGEPASRRMPIKRQRAEDREGPEQNHEVLQPGEHMPGGLRVNTFAPHPKAEPWLAAECARRATGSRERLAPVESR